MSGEPVEMELDWTASGRPFRHYFEVCVGSGHAALALRADWQAHLRKCREGLGFQYVRFHGLLNDDMSVCTGRPDAPEHRFHNVDLIFDFLREIGMRPFIELSFMPTVLASGERTCFHYRGNVTPPRDYGQWGDLIGALAQHLAARYGREEVAQWYFEVWNEPNLDYFWAGTQEDYFRLYRHAAEAVKAVDRAFRVGGPSTALNGWVADMREFCETSGVPLDFLSTHHYPTDVELGHGLDMEDRMAASRRGILTEWARKAREEAGDLPLHYTEWNTSPSCTDPYHDAPYAAAFLLKTVADNEGLVDSYSFWTFSDIFEEAPFPSRPFHGGFGLLNVHGIEKPSYQAARFLHELGETRLPVEQPGGRAEAMAVRDGRAVDVLLWNYDVPRSGIKPAEVRLAVTGAPGPLTATLERVDDDHADPAAEWRRMGEPEYLDADQVARLMAAGTTACENLPVSAEDGVQSVRLTLPVWGSARVRLSVP